MRNCIISLITTTVATLEQAKSVRWSFRPSDILWNSNNKQTCNILLCASSAEIFLKKGRGNEIIFQLFERTFEHLEIRLQKWRKKEAIIFWSIKEKEDKIENIQQVKDRIWRSLKTNINEKGYINFSKPSVL